MPIDRAEAAAEAARQRALELAREAQERAKQEAARRAAEAAKAANAAQAQKVADVRKSFKKDEMSEGRGGALRRTATKKLAALGLDPKQPPAAATKPDPVQDAAKLASIKNPADRAQAFEKLIGANTDPGYRAQLISQSKASLADIATQVVNKTSGASTHERQVALESLSRATEQLDAKSQQALAATFAGTMKNQNVGDDSDEFGTLMKDAVKSGSGASLGVRLASALQSSDQTTAANDLSKFVGQGIGDLRKQFDDDNQKVEQLHQQLGQELGAWKLDGKDQTTALKQFDAEHHLNDAQAKLENDGALLASTLNGSAIAESDPALKSGADAKQSVFAGRAGSMSVQKYSNESDLRSASHDALSELPALANTKAGSEAIAKSLMAQGLGQPTFIQQAQGDAQNAPNPAKALTNLRTAVTQSMGTKLLESAKAGNFDETSSELLKGLQKNAKLYGVNAKELQGLTDTLKQFKPGMAADTLEQVSTDAAKKIASLNAPGPVGQAFKGLTVIYGAVGAIDGWKNFSAEDVQQKLTTVSQTLNVGQTGAQLVTGTLTRFAANSAGTSETGTAATVAAEETGLGAAKLLGAGIGALGTVVSGWQAVDAFEQGKTAQGVGDSISALGGAVATAGLFLDGTVAGVEVGVVLNVVGGVLAAAGGLVSLFGGSGNPFSGQEKDVGDILQKMGVKQDVADQLKDFNSDGENFGTWVSAVAGKLDMSTGDFVRSMNGWSHQQVADFLDAARLQHDTDSNNDHRLDNASAVLGKQNAQNLEDPSYVPMPGRFGGYDPNAQQKADAQRKAQAAERQTVDKKSGVITYDPALVDAAVAWVRRGRQ